MTISVKPSAQTYHFYYNTTIKQMFVCKHDIQIGSRILNELFSAQGKLHEYKTKKVPCLHFKV